jgi:hypothetical protein
VALFGADRYWLPRLGAFAVPFDAGPDTDHTPPSQQNLDIAPVRSDILLNHKTDDFRSSARHAA